jgi:hypothetical protein
MNIWTVLRECFCKGDVNVLVLECQRGHVMQWFKSWSVLIGLVVFTACSSLPSPSQSYVLTLQIGTDATPQIIEQRYSGKVLAWLPQQNTALLKTEHLPNQADAAVRHIEDNQAIKTTEGKLSLNQPSNLQTTGASTSGSVIGMSGWSTWSSGWSTWSNGWNTWSNSSNTMPPLPSANSTAFQSIRLPQAHAVAKNYGAGITVAVLDTGIDLSHPGFVGKLAPSSLYKDFVGHDDNPSEELGWSLGHGTAVAGLILQVAPAAKILPIRVLSSNGNGDLDDLILGIDHAIRSGAKVINVSLGTIEYSEALAVMIQSAQANQVYVVAAAGNSSRQDQADYPAKLAETDTAWDYLFSIGSVKNNDALSSFTNRGSDVTFYAPGEGITTFFPGNATINATGTSFSAPLFSGALALGLSNTDPTYHSMVGSYMRYYQEQQSIWWTINNGGATAYEHNYGRLDLERFLLMLPGFVANPPRAGRTDFVTNGSFENGNYVGWTSARAIINGFTDFFSGGYSVVLSRAGWISQRLTGLAPNTTYVASAWIRVGGSNQSANLVAKNFGRTTVTKVVPSASIYQKVTLEFTTGTANTTADISFEKPSGTATATGDLFSVIRK